MKQYDKLPIQAPVVTTSPTELATSLLREGSEARERSQINLGSLFSFTPGCVPCFSLVTALETVSCSFLHERERERYGYGYG